MPALDLDARPARPGDLPVLESITEAAVAPYAGPGGALPEPAGVDLAAEVAADRIWVAARSEQVVGYLRMTPTSSHLLVDSLALAPADTGTDAEAGPLLLAVAEQLAWELGVGQLRMTTDAAMQQNLALCQRLGWVEMRREHQGGRDRVVLAKDV